MNETTKRQWYMMLMDNMEEAINKEFYLEAIFIEYIIIDDRLKSICKSVSISVTDREMLGSLIQKVKGYIQENPHGILVGCLNDNNLIQNIYDWKEERNKWIHDAGNEKLTYEDYKNEVSKLALDGKELVKLICNAVQRLRKQKSKI